MSVVPETGLIDGDIIVYRVGFSSEEVPWKICASRVNNFIDNIMDGADLTSYKGFITATGPEDRNFRYKLATEVPYKGNRPANKPKHYDSIRKYLVESHGFRIAYTIEADDVIAIRATEERDSVIICSIDKDFRQVPGFHYNFVSGKLDYVTDEEANFNFYTQLLTGDRVDNIPGLRGIGPVKAAKILRSTDGTAVGMYTECVAQYVKSYNCSEEEAKIKILERARLLYLLRDKYFTMWAPPGVTND